MHYLMVSGFVDAVYCAVCAEFDCTRKELMGQSRRKAFTVPRWIVMYLLRKARLSYPEVGRRVGGRDHSTVIKDLRKLDGLMREDHLTSGRVNLIAGRLDSWFATEPESFAAGAGI